jgi:hypothetical protein
VANSNEPQIEAYLNCIVCAGYSSLGWYEAPLNRAERNHHLAPDFLSGMVALANFMRLSLRKGAHAALSGAASQEIRGCAERPPMIIWSILFEVNSLPAEEPSIKRKRSRPDECQRYAHGSQ